MAVFQQKFTDDTPAFAIVAGDAAGLCAIGAAVEHHHRYIRAHAFFGQTG